MSEYDEVRNQDPILDARGLLSDTLQLRFVAHELSMLIFRILTQNPTLMFTMPEDFAEIMQFAAGVHEVTCPKAAAKAAETAAAVARDPQQAHYDENVRRLFRAWEPEQTEDTPIEGDDD